MLNLLLTYYLSEEQSCKRDLIWLYCSSHVKVDFILLTKLVILYMQIIRINLWKTSFKKFLLKTDIL